MSTHAYLEMRSWGRRHVPLWIRRPFLRLQVNAATVYHWMIPARLRKVPLATGFLIFWIWLGGALIYTRLWELFWPQDLADRPRGDVRYYVGGVMILGALLMLLGKLAARRWPLAIGSALEFGICGMFLLGQIRVLRSEHFLYPEVIFSSIIWFAFTVTFLVSLIENRRVVNTSERVKG